MKGYSFVRKLYRRSRNSLRRQGTRIPMHMTRPFEPQDLLPVPEGYAVGPPDFVGIASSKAGTGWWYRLLLEHPAIEPNRLACKELSYFCHFSYKGLDSAAISTYRQAFAAPAGCVCGEWSPGYLSYPLAIDYLAQTAPDAKLLAIARNPVDRVISGLNQQLSARLRYMNLNAERAYVYRTFSLLPWTMSSVLYYEKFRRLFQVFDRSQLLLLQYERCAQDPAAQISRTYRFLGLDDSHIPASLDRKVNVRPYIVPQLEPHERAILADYFSDDVRGLAELFPEIDLSLWPDFEDH